MAVIVFVFVVKISGGEVRVGVLNNVLYGWLRPSPFYIQFSDKVDPAIYLKSTRFFF